MTTEFLKYLIEQSSGIVIALILIVRVDRRLEDLTKSINKLSELISNDEIKKHENQKVENKDTTYFQIGAKNNSISESAPQKKAGDLNIRAIPEPTEIREQASIDNRGV